MALWLADLELQDLVDQTKENYRDDIRLHVLPTFQYFTLGEITTGRVDRFLKSELAVSYSRAKHSRTMLNLLFGFARSIRAKGGQTLRNARRAFTQASAGICKRVRIVDWDCPSSMLL